ncbi:hypothetical protein GCM10022199_15990 [Marihabitans asiaticum]
MTSHRGPVDARREGPVDSTVVVGRSLAVVRRGVRVASVGSVVYVVYVVALLSAVYLLPYGHMIFTRFGDSATVQLLISPVALLLALALVLTSPLVAYRAGAVRGPVAPPPVWVRHVVAGPADTAVSLRRWWLLAAAGATGVIAVLLTFVGLSLWSAGIIGWRRMLLGVAGSILVGAAAARCWLAGQVAAVGGGHPLRASRALRALTAGDLTGQDERGERVAGAVLAGDREGLARELGRRSARHRGRLRPGRAVMLRRDLLAVRRGPGLAQTISVLLLGSGLLGYTLTRSLPLAVLASLVLYRAVTLWGAGLRQQVSPVVPVLGWSEGRQRATHLLLPAAGATIGGAVSAALALVLAGRDVAAGGGVAGLAPFAAPLLLVPVQLLVLVWTATREGPALVTVMPQQMLPRVVLWWFTPAIVLLGASAAILALLGPAP